MKQSEAKVLIYLNQVDRPFRYIAQMAPKLNMDNAYLSKIIKGMLFKEWISKARTLQAVKVHYNLTPKGRRRIEQAKEVLSK